MLRGSCVVGFDGRAEEGEREMVVWSLVREWEDLCVTFRLSWVRERVMDEGWAAMRMVVGLLADDVSRG